MEKLAADVHCKAPQAQVFAASVLWATVADFVNHSLYGITEK